MKMQNEPFIIKKINGMEIKEDNLIINSNKIKIQCIN